MMTPTIAALVSISEWIELSILVKATILLAFGLAAARVAARARASVRHLLLAATFATLVILPLVVIGAPDVTIEMPAASVSGQPARVSETQTSRTAPSQAGPVDPRATQAERPAWPQIWLTVARWGWAAGTAALLVSLAAAFWRVRRIRRDSLPRPELRTLVESLAAQAGIARSVEILEHEEVVAPLTCGVWRPAILLPTGAREWTPPDVARALAHELEHVRRYDWAVQLGARAVCACYWFHPLTWMALRRMCLEAERACDDAVVRIAERTDYAEQLVVLARQLLQPHAPAMLGMANRSDLSTRVTALLDDSLARGRAGLAVASGTVLAATLAVVTIAPLRAVAFVSPTETHEVSDRSDVASVDSGQASERSAVTVLQRRRPRALDRALYEAAENGDLDEVNELLQAGANINGAVDGDGSPLIGAVRSGELSLVRHLLDRGADVNMPVEGDGSPLIVASEKGALPIVQLLLDRRANPDQLVPGDESALIQASGSGHLEVVKLLVARGANVNLGVWVEENRGAVEWRSPLSMARKNRQTAVVEFLVGAGARD